MSSTTYCTKCKRTPHPGSQFKKCSRCRMAAYCSKKCQMVHWDVHGEICVPCSPNEVWGIRITVKNSNSTRTWKPLEYFQHELLSSNHPIFSRGESCPVTKRVGVPLIIYSTRLHGEGGTAGLNETSGKPRLRVEDSDGFAPPSWQKCEGPGECIVVREDGKPLTRELLEALYSFIVDLMAYPGITNEAWASWQGLLAPSVWQMYARKYYQAQNNAGRLGFDDFFPLVD
ncbi:hypothetical protein BDP27DRAFT_1234707 [Rhodocollybia butyracea]|uniref:MYND-type domain-containing protein n=1 Tax=Rhodocollybia butyracea TaxID=206335 RepID=A0A9P5PE41_9AGAR|nr:hypothetical protein BDP27DRAFT_1234707 [Rhodocollybia butyracea]